MVISGIDKQMLFYDSMILYNIPLRPILAMAQCREVLQSTLYSVIVLLFQVFMVRKVRELPGTVRTKISSSRLLVATYPERNCLGLVTTVLNSRYWVFMNKYLISTTILCTQSSIPESVSISNWSRFLGAPYHFWIDVQKILVTICLFLFFTVIRSVCLWFV